MRRILAGSIVLAFLLGVASGSGDRQGREPTSRRVVEPLVSSLPAPLPTPPPPGARPRVRPVAPVSVPAPLAKVSPAEEARPWDWRKPRPGSDLQRKPLVRTGQVKQPPARTHELLLYLSPGADAKSLARDLGIEARAPLAGNADIWVFRAPTPDAAEKARAAAAADRRVVTAFLNRRIHRVKMWVPNDPYLPNNAQPGFPGQWHLGNGTSSFHANLGPAWARDLTGAGVTLSAVDDGLDTSHPDITANFVAANSYNFGFPSGPDVNPYAPYDNTVDEDRHGTAVAGVAAAVGGNGVGVTGAAPLASLAFQRIDFQTLTDADITGAVLYHSSSGNTTIKVKNHSYATGDTYVDDTPERNAVSTSAAAGTVHVYAAGNYRGSYLQDTNKQMPHNWSEVITVTALGSNGVYSDYTNFGACVFVTAPSSSSGQFEILTTDRSGVRGYCPNLTLPPPPSPGPGDLDPYPDQNYTSTFGGTSSAAPLVTGILALAKQANPNMTVRMAQHALVRSSTQIDVGDSSISGGWTTNGAGFKFNQNYGFGLINADALTQQVVRYNGVSPIQYETTGTTTVMQGIPDNSSTGVTQTFTLTQTLPLEGVLVTLHLTHPYRGDLEAYLTSPSGTVSRLMIASGADFGALPDPSWVSLSGWTFLSNAFWGENPAGTWTLNVRDVQPADLGTWSAYNVTTRMGRPTLAGTVADGLSGPDLDTQPSTTSMSANWTGFSDPTIPVTAFAWAIGTSPGATNVMGFVDVGLQTSASTSTDNNLLALTPGSTYYVTVRATDDKGIPSFASSDGVQITGSGSAPQPPVLHGLAQPAGALLEWDPSPSPTVSHYRLWYKFVGAPWIQATVVDNLLGTSTLVGGLTNGATYNFMLKAVTATGDESQGSFAVVVPANQITVNTVGNYATIQQAIDAAAIGGGFVSVLAGTYTENLTLPDNVSLFGASPRHTIISSPSGSADVITATGTFGMGLFSTISGIGVTGGRVGIVGGSADLIVQNVVVHDMGSHGITMGLSGRLRLINCTLAHNGGDGVQSLGATQIRNTIAASNAAFGLNAPMGSFVTYSNSYGNPSGNYTAGIVDGTDVTNPVAFLDEAGNDFREAFGAVSTDAGDPLDPFGNEPPYNGARINQGAFGNTSWAARSPAPVLGGGGGGGGGGGCGLNGLEGLLLLALLRRARSVTRSR